MRLLPPALAAHVAAGTTTLADLLKITRKDGQVFAWTSAADDVTIDSVVYKSAEGLDISSMEHSAGLNVDNLELTTLDDGTVFTQLDVLSGRWRNASFVISRYNWATPADGVDARMAGTVGEVRLHRGYITAELRGLQQYLQQPIGSVTSKTCRARLGDSMCSVNMTAFTHNNTVGQVESNQRFGPVLGGDAFYSSVSLALHFDGANGGTVFTDSSANNLSPSSLVGATAVTTTADKKFGVTSVYFDGYFTGSEAIVYNSNALFGFGASDFTLEVWIKRTSNTGPINNHVCSSSSWNLFCTSGGALGVGFPPANGGIPTVFSSINLNLNTWYFVALVRSGNVWSIYVDGVLGMSVTNSVNVGSSAPFTIGSASGNPCCITGYMDEIRVTKGVARYTAAFTPPTQAFDVQPQFVAGGNFADNYFAEGIVTFTSGPNSGLAQKVKASESAGYINTSLPFLSTPAPGDSYTITAGCQKRLADCATKFGNAINFQGEPHLPGIDQVTAPV